MNEPGMNEPGVPDAAGLGATDVPADSGGPGTALGDGPGRPGSRLPRWALSTWPAAWRERYGEEVSDTWAETGARRRAAVGIAVRGLQERIARPLPAGLAASPLGPAWDMRPSWRRRGIIAGVAASVVLAGSALVLALHAPPDTLAEPSLVEMLLFPLVAVAGAGGGLRLAARPGFRSVGHGLAVGALGFALMPTLVVFPWPLLLGLVVLVGRWGAGARHATRRARLAAIVAGLYALLVVAAGGLMLAEPLLSPEPDGLIGIWLILVTEPLSFMALALPIAMPEEALVPVLLGCGVVQCVVLHRLIRGRR